MSLKLKEAVFRVKCREAGCPFISDFTVKENIMGATEADVDSEAWKIARNLAYIKHDSLYGRKHPLGNPEIWKVSGTYDRLGQQHAAGAPAPASMHEASAPTRAYRRGQRITEKGESAMSVCEVVRGSVCNAAHPDLLYKPGTTFGTAALFKHKVTLVDMTACEDDTVVRFYNIGELSKTDPAKARELYDEAMDDILRLLNHLEAHARSLETRVKKLKAESAALKKKKKPAPAARARKIPPRAPKKATPKRKKTGVKKTAATRGRRSRPPKKGAKR